MKLFQELINLVKKLQSMQTKSVLNGKTINLTGDNIAISSTKFSVDKNGKLNCSDATLSGKITATGGTIGGFEVIRERLRSTNKKVGMSSSTWAGDPAFWAGNIDPWENHNWMTNTPFLVTNQGKLIARDATITGGKIRVQGNRTSQDILRVENNNNNSIFSYMQPIGAGYINGDSSQAIYIMAGNDISSIEVRHGGSSSEIRHDKITTPTLIQTSLAEHKKNFEKMQDNALEIIKNIDIYKYNLKNEKDTDKKHIGFVIGDNYNYSKEVTSIDNKGVDNYSFTSLCCKAIQEQQEQIEELKKEIEKLKGGK